MKGVLKSVFSGLLKYALIVIGAFTIFFFLYVNLWLTHEGQIQAAARKAISHGAVNEIAKGLMAYRNEYGEMPKGNSRSILQSLLGENPRKITFIDLPQQRFFDPWKNRYRIDVSDPANPKVWSPGKNKKDEPDDPQSDDICSWR